MLYFISTPIGNLNDISLRAIDVIRTSEYLYAEDTRHIKKLLDFVDIKFNCKSFHEHNEEKVSKQIIQKLKDNKMVCIVSDAGTPAISDPGYRLIKLCIQHNLEYTLIPGPSSVISGLVMSGLPTDKFSFYGFMPKKLGDQKKIIEKLNYEEKTAIFFESSKRIKATIENFRKYLDTDRSISICKEMTKIHENIIRDKVSKILSHIDENQINLKGELVIVLEGNKENRFKFQINPKIKNELLSKLSASESAKLISSITGMNKRDIYKTLIEK